MGTMESTNLCLYLTEADDLIPMVPTNGVPFEYNIPDCSEIGMGYLECLFALSLLNTAYCL